MMQLGRRWRMATAPPRTLTICGSTPHASMQASDWTAKASWSSTAPTWPRLLAHGLEDKILDLLLVRLNELGLVSGRGRQRTDSTRTCSPH